MTRSLSDQGRGSLSERRDVVKELQGVVLLLEDDESVRKSLSLFLTLAGLEVQSYATVGAFLSQPWPRSGAACALLDVFLPDGSGLDVQECLARRQPQLPVIMMSALATEALVSRARAAGAFAFFNKPIDCELLLTEIERALATPGQRSA